MAESDSNSTTTAQNSLPRISTPVLSNNHTISVKLNDDNFLIWKQHILAIVRGYRLESHLTGSLPIPPEFIVVNGSDQMEVNEDFLAWTSQDQLLSAWIQASLSDSALILVVGLSSAKDIWNALETNFASQSKAKVMQFRLQLQTLKKDYLNKVKSCCDLLGAAGCRVPEQDQILYILAGLGHEYDSMMVTITSRGDMWTVQDVTALLLSFELRLDSGKQSTVGADGVLPTANFAHVSGKKRDNNYQSNRRGFYGKSEGGRGHFGAGHRGEVVEKEALVPKLFVNCTKNQDMEQIGAGRYLNKASLQQDNSTRHAATTIQSLYQHGSNSSSSATSSSIHQTSIRVQL